MENDERIANPYQSPRTLPEEKTANRRNGRWNQTSANKAYRRSALPFGLFMLVAGIVFGIAAFEFPAHAIFIPPFEAEMTKRAMFILIAVCVFVMGMGFVMRRVWALYAFVVYVLLGTAFYVVVGLIDPASRWLILSPLINLPIGLAIYWATRPAFLHCTPDFARRNTKNQITKHD